MSTNRKKVTNSYDPIIVDSRSYAQVLKACGQKGVNNGKNVASKAKSVNLHWSVTSVVNDHCQNSFRDDTCSIFQSKGIEQKRSYLSAVVNAASNTTKDNSMTADASQSRGGASYFRDISNDKGAGKDKQSGKLGSNPVNRMGQEMATPLVPVYITLKALAPGDIAQNGVGSGWTKQTQKLRTVARLMA